MPAPIRAGTRLRCWRRTARRIHSLSNNLRIPLHRLSAQITVEHHADVADQQPARRQHPDEVALDGDEAIGFERRQLTQFFREIARKIDGELLCDTRHVQLEMTDELSDHLAAQQVVGIESDTAMNRQLAGVAPLVVLLEFLYVLAIRIAAHADSGNAEGDQVALSVGG